MTTTLTLIRGLPGSGKSTEAAKIMEREPTTFFEADQYFYDEEGNYLFLPQDLPEAHEQCQKGAAISLERGVSCIVANTFTQRWELEPYLKMAGQYGANLTIIDVFDGECSDEALAERNIHGVPVESIRRMRERYERDWWDGSPTRPF